MKRKNLYLETVELEEAKRLYYDKLATKITPLPAEEIPLGEALGRVTTEAIFARFSSPLYNASAMDGIAVKAEDTIGASEEKAIFLRKDQYEEVDTGDALPEGCDAVIMAEDLIEDTEGYRIHQAVQSWQSVRPVGEDIVVGEMVVAGNTILRPMDLNVIAASGYRTVKVYRKIKAAILPTGSEIVEVNDNPQRGDIFESNSLMLAGQLQEWGVSVTREQVVADDYETLKKRILTLVEDNDLLVVNAGTSAGREDFMPSLLRELGEVVVHGVAIKPGKPVILAIVQGKPVVGLPGYPVAAFIAMQEFVAPIIEWIGHTKIGTGQIVEAISTRQMISSLRHQEYVRVCLGKVNDKLVATPLARGAGAAMSLAKADGICRIPLEKEGILAGEKIEVQLLRPMHHFEKTMVAIGSHDLILDVLDNQMAASGSDYRLSSSHVGSLSGLISLQKKECHIAPTHLLGNNGIYNEEAMKRIFKEPMVLIRGVGRVQGLMVKKGNPLNIKSLEDLKHVSFVNRQRGAGTRVLLDACLKTLGISPEEIDGYQHEASTHMAVAIAVKDGGVDCGLGIYAAAQNMGLDFIPISEERYDFAVYPNFPQSDLGKAFIEALSSKEFHKELENMGGYRFDNIGEICDVKPS